MVAKFFITTERLNVQNVALKKIEFDYQNESCENSIFDVFRLSYQVWVGRSQTQCLTIPYGYINQTFDCYVAEWNTAKGFWGKQVCFFLVKREHFHISALSVLKKCSAWRLPRNIFNEWRSAHRKEMVETMREDYKKVVLIWRDRVCFPWRFEHLCSYWQLPHSIFLVLENKHKSGQSRCTFKSRKISTSILIDKV